jgi:hypothetical protein
MAIFSRESFDHPLVFSLAVTLVVLFWFGVFSWAMVKFKATGPLSVVKGGVMS